MPGTTLSWAMATGVPVDVECPADLVSPTFESASSNQSTSMEKSYFLKIVEILELDRSAAEDREKRLLNRIDHLTRKVEALTNEMTALQSAQDDNGGQRRQGSPSVQKSSQKKQKRVAASSPGVPVPVAGCPQKELVRDSVEPCSSVVRTEQQDTSVTEASRVVHQMDPDAPTDAKPGKQGLSRMLPTFEEDAEGSNLWQLICTKKPTGRKAVHALFVGNLLKDCDADTLCQYVQRRVQEVGVKVQIHDCTLFPKEKGHSARLILNRTSIELVNTKEFWPSPYYSRKWNFHQVPWIWELSGYAEA